MGPVEVLWDEDWVPPRKNMGPVEVLWDGDGVDGDEVPPQPEQTAACENITSVNIPWDLISPFYGKQFLFTNLKKVL